MNTLQKLILASLFSLVSVQAWSAPTLSAHPGTSTLWLSWDLTDAQRVVETLQNPYNPMTFHHLELTSKNITTPIIGKFVPIPNVIIFPGAYRAGDTDVTVRVMNSAGTAVNTIMPEKWIVGTNDSSVAWVADGNRTTFHYGATTTTQQPPVTEKTTLSYVKSSDGKGGTMTLQLSDPVGCFWSDLQKKELCRDTGTLHPSDIAGFGIAGFSSVSKGTSNTLVLSDSKLVSGQGVSIYATLKSGEQVWVSLRATPREGDVQVSGMQINLTNYTLTLP